MPDSSFRSVANWQLQQKIGQGSFAVVWKAVHAETGNFVAVKEISTDRLNKKLKQSLESEVSILKQIRHRNIVHLEDVVEESSCLFLVMEFCAGGDLAGYIRRCKRLPEVTACAVMRQLGAGLKELWSRHMVHRDLKPQNLLLSDHSPQAVLKIADFGFARHLQQHQLADTLCGSPLYMAPEILQSHKYDAKADLWSVGTILYELVVGRPPFNGSNPVALLNNIERHEARIPDQIAKNLSPACIDLIYSLLKRNPVQRISFEEFFNHPFLAATIPLAATVHSEAPVSEMLVGESGVQKPVQRIAGQAATGPEEDLPFVLDDDAVAQAYEERLQEQQAADLASGHQADAAEMQALRPRYGHRSPASALAGRQFVQATSHQRPPLGASPRLTGLSPAPKPPSIPNTPPLAAGPLPVASLLASTQVQGRPVQNHPLQSVRGANSMGSSMEEDGFVIVNPPSPSSSGHQPISRRPSAGWQGTLLTRLRSDSLPTRHHHQQQQPPPQHRTQQEPAAHVPSPVQQQQLHAQLPLHQHTAVPSHSVTTGHSATVRQPSEAMGTAVHGPAIMHPQPAVVRAIEPEAEPEMGSSQALASLADLLDELAAELEGKDRLPDGLSLRLLAMQLLHAVKQNSTSCTESAHAAGSPQNQHLQEQSDMQLPAVSMPQSLLSSKQVDQRLLEMYSKARDSLSVLKQDGEGVGMPYVWQVVYEAARSFARTGATQEIIGAVPACIQPYSQAVRLLVFVHSEAEGLPLKPQLKLAPSDKARLQYCSLQLRGRQALCKSALHQADTASLN